MLKLGIISYKLQVLDVSYWWLTLDQKPLLVNYPGFHLERTGRNVLSSLHTVRCLRNFNIISCFDLKFNDFRFLQII